MVGFSAKQLRAPGSRSGWQRTLGIYLSETPRIRDTGMRTARRRQYNGLKGKSNQQNLFQTIKLLTEVLCAQSPTTISPCSGPKSGKSTAEPQVSRRRGRISVVCLETYAATQKIDLRSSLTI